MPGVRLYGSIPAGAGKPYHRHRVGRRGEVYPRGRGEADAMVKETPLRRGLSPRARGSHFDIRYFKKGTGSIPAGAGKPAPM